MTTPCRFWHLVAFAGLFLSQSGCWPGIAWLPDSSGFYFTAGQSHEKLMFFDVAAKKTRVVVADTKGHTLWPAVKPDGKEIAVARLLSKQNGPAVQLAFFSPHGKELRVSKAFPVETKSPWTSSTNLRPCGATFLGPGWCPCLDLHRGLGWYLRCGQGPLDRY